MGKKKAGPFFRSQLTVNKMVLANCMCLIGARISGHWNPGSDEWTDKKVGYPYFPPLTGSDCTEITLNSKNQF